MSEENSISTIIYTMSYSYFTSEMIKIKISLEEGNEIATSYGQYPLKIYRHTCRTSSELLLRLCDNC